MLFYRSILYTLSWMMQKWTFNVLQICFMLQITNGEGLQLEFVLGEIRGNKFLEFFVNWENFERKLGIFMDIRTFGYKDEEAWNCTCMFCSNQKRVFQIPGSASSMSQNFHTKTFFMDTDSLIFLILDVIYE